MYSGTRDDVHAAVSFGNCGRLTKPPNSAVRKHLESYEGVFQSLTYFFFNITTTVHESDLIIPESLRIAKLKTTRQQSVTFIPS